MTRKMSRQRMRAPLMVALAAMLLTGVACGDEPQTRGRLMSVQFTQTDGGQLYEAICQGCHMPGGTGAAGAAAYPALAKDRHLAVKGFPIARVLQGSKAMPAFKDLLSDEQIATVVAYVRTSFGNTYKDKVTAADVKALR